MRGEEEGGGGGGRKRAVALPCFSILHNITVKCEQENGATTIIVTLHDYIDESKFALFLVCCYKMLVQCTSQRCV